MPITQHYDLDIDTTLGGNNASDYIIPSQKAIKAYVDNNSGGGATALSGLTDVTLTSPAAGDVLAYDGSGWVNNNKYLKNTATSTNAITINGTATTGNDGNYSINIGDNSACNGGSCVSIGDGAIATKDYDIVIGSTARTYTGSGSGTSRIAIGSLANATGGGSVAIGLSAQTTKSESIAIGGDAQSTAYGAIQLGRGTNNNAYSLMVGFYDTEEVNYKLIDKTGLIPDARLSSNIARMPDYANGISLVGLTTYICPSDGWISCAGTNSGTAFRYVYRNGSTEVFAKYGDGTYLSSFCKPVLKNDEITISAAFYGAAYFYPMKGA